MVEDFEETIKTVVKGYLVFFLVGLVAFFGKKYLSTQLLKEELLSEKKVQEILGFAQSLLSPSQEVIFNNKKLALFPKVVFNTPAEQEKSDWRVLGENSDSRWIEINLSQQRLYAHEGEQIIGNYLVSTGLWAATPTGTFRIWIKLPSTTMAGGSRALGTYYYLPNVPCTMYFYKGYGIHGTYWHNNFGHPMSHGCVNMRTPDACTLFGWASVGTKVVIHY